VKLLLGFILILQSIVLSAQNKNDSTYVVFEDTTKRVKLSYALNWDGRTSFINKKPVNVWGVNTGLIFGKKRHQFTVGYYWMTYNSFLRLIDLRKDAAQRINLDFYTKTDFGFFSFMYWRNLYDDKRFRVSMPIELGVGSSTSSKNLLKDDLRIWRHKDIFIPAQAGLFFKWKATRYVGLMVQGGYRYALYQQNIDNNYDGWYYSYGFTIESALFEDAWRGIKKISKKKSEKSTNQPNN
jgi:hypothetical protein